MDIIVGTAGHIDHGKTALVKALTGIDADRLPEEKQRGITIDLGFAEMDAEDVRIGFVDVPGHERFVKNMLAGAGGIDVVLLVVAADEGVMPQTREHFHICRLLRIKSGIIALTKADLADGETLELARMDVAELVGGSFLENAPILPVSSRSGAGIAELKDALIREAKNLRREDDIYETRLPIDRSFSVKGFGAVVTGTLGSGAIKEGDELELLPSRRKVRARGVQTYGRSVAAAQAGQRTAVNLGGISHEDVERGMVLTTPGSLGVTQVFDADVGVLTDSPRPLRSRQRVRLHLGTTEVLARVDILNHGNAIEPGSKGYVQFRLESAVAAAAGDMFIVRSYSPQRTIAGGRVLDPHAAKHRQSQLEGVSAVLDALSQSGEQRPDIFIRIAGDKGLSFDTLRARTGLRAEILRAMVDDDIKARKIVNADGVMISAEAFDRLQAAALDAIDEHHRRDKLSRGISRETLREQIFRRVEPEVFRAITNELVRAGKIALDQDVFRLASYETTLSDSEKKTLEAFRQIYSSANLEVPKLEDALVDTASACGVDSKAARKIFQLLLNNGEVVSVTNEFYFPASVIDELAAKIREQARSSGDAMIDVAKFKQIAGVSRKYAIPLLEYFDRTRVTRRIGDKRQIL
jgi:selenocysteine-specific elongation factor